MGEILPDGSIQGYSNYNGKCNIQGDNLSINKNKESQLLELVKHNKGGQTWWMSDFYEDYCKLFKLDFNQCIENAPKIRYQLNKLVSKGLLKKTTVGVGYNGRGIFNSNHFTMWILK